MKQTHITMQYAVAYSKMNDGFIDKLNGCHNKIVIQIARLQCDRSVLWAFVSFYEMTKSHMAHLERNNIKKACGLIRFKQVARRAARRPLLMILKFLFRIF